MPTVRSHVGEGKEDMTDIERTVLHFIDVAREPGTEGAMYLPVKDARVITGEITRLRAIAKACGRISAYLTEQSIKDQAETNGELIRLRAVNAELVAALEEISLGRGPFKIYPMAHAESVIETMKDVAKDALKRAKE